jgi:hypothetical protein
LYIFVGRGICFITGIQSKASSEFNALDFMNNNTTLWIFIMFPVTFMMFHIGQSIAEVRADPNGGRYRARRNNVQDQNEYMDAPSNVHEYMHLPSSSSSDSSGHTASSSSSSSSMFFQSAARPDGGDDYNTEFLKRWAVWVGIQFTVFVSGFYAPNGSPQWFPTLSLNILALGLVVEMLFGKNKGFCKCSNGLSDFLVFVSVVCICSFIQVQLNLGLFVHGRPSIMSLLFSYLCCPLYFCAYGKLLDL